MVGLPAIPVAEAARAGKVIGEQAVRIALGTDLLQTRPCIVGKSFHLAPGLVGIAPVLADSERLQSLHGSQMPRSVSVIVLLALVNDVGAEHDVGA